MANSKIDTLYAGSLRIKIHVSFPSNITFYKWCVTKVAHCTVPDAEFVSEVLRHYLKKVVFEVVDFNSEGCQLFTKTFYHVIEIFISGCSVFVWNDWRAIIRIVYIRNDVPLG